MLIKVLSRIEAERFSRINPEEKTVIISIVNVGDEEADLKDQPNIIDVLRLSFDDVYQGGENCMTDDDARKIAEFVNRYKDVAEQIVIHCGAGVSRSAGVGSALAFVLNGNEKELEHSAFFIPNTTVFQKVLKAFWGEVFNVSD